MAWFKTEDIAITQFDNGTFEAPLSQWGNYFNMVNISRVSESKSGTYAALLSGGSTISLGVPSWMDPDGIIETRQFLSFHSPQLSAGRYKIKMSIKSKIDGWPLDGGQCRIYLYTASGTLVSFTSAAISEDNAWYDISYEFDLADKRAVQMNIVAAWTSGYTYNEGRTEDQATYIDDISLEHWEDVPDLNLSYFAQNCSLHGADDGYIALTNTQNGSGDYSISWSNGAVDVNSISGLAPGIYSVDIHDNITGQDQTLDNIVITEPPPPTINVSGIKTNVNCPGAADGTITLTVSGGDGGPYSYAWSDGSENKDRVGLEGGSYQVIVTDQSGGSGNASFEIAEAPPIVIDATVDGTNIFIQVSGGTPPYLFEWSDGPTSSDRENVLPGEYTLVVTDSLGCFSQVTVEVSEFRFKFSQDPVILELQADDPETKLNLSFKCEVYVERIYKSGSYDLIATLEQPADNLGATVFDVQSILNGVEELKTHLPDNNLARADSVFKRFYLRYTERYGNPPEDAPFSQSDIQYVVLGGLSYEEFASDYFFSDYLLNYPFFTWQANGRYVFKDEPHYLYFIVPEFGISQFRVNVRINYLDGSFIDFHPFVKAGIDRYELYCIPAGYSQLLLELQGTKEIFSYSIHVDDGAGKALSEKRTFLVTREYFAVKRFFMYRNAIGGFDTLAATAASVLQASAKGNTIVKNLPHNYRVEDGKEEIISKDLERSLESGSGYTRRRIDLQRMQDFISSEDVFLYQNGRYIPVLIKAKGTVEDDQGMPGAIKFTAQLPVSRNYTPYLQGEAPDIPETSGEYLAVNDVLLKIQR